MYVKITEFVIQPLRFTDYEVGSGIANSAYQGFPGFL